MKTKERIMFASIDLFAIRGYKAVSMRDIGREVGIRESSIYKHFSGKQAIMDAIVVEANLQITMTMEKLKVPDGLSEQGVSSYLNMDINQIAELCTNMLLALINNEFIQKFRQILTMEQYQNPAFAKMRNDLFINRQLDYNENVFSVLLDRQIVKGKSAKCLAVEFFSVFYLLQDKYFNERAQLKEELNEQVISFLEQHQGGKA